MNRLFQTKGPDLGLSEIKSEIIRLHNITVHSIEEVRDFEDPDSQLQILVQQCIDNDVLFTAAIEALQDDLGTAQADLSALDDLVELMRSYMDTSSTLQMTVQELLDRPIPSAEQYDYLVALQTSNYMIDDSSTLTRARGQTGLAFIAGSGEEEEETLMTVEVIGEGEEEEEEHVLDGYASLHTAGFVNRASADLLDTELVTWGLLKAFIDVVLPVGVLMLSSNGAPPASFGGYLTWEVYAAADTKYLKMTNSSGVVGTLQAEQLVEHLHALGAGVTVGGGGAHLHTITELATSAVGDHTHPGSRTVTKDDDPEDAAGGHVHRHRYYTSVTSSGSVQVVSNANQTELLPNAPFTQPPGNAGDGRHAHNLLVAADGGHTHLVSGDTDMVDAHTHTVGGSTELVAGGGATNEVESIYVLIYVRVA